MIVHAGLIARRVNQRWRGVLVEGPSGGGKSDLALRALDEGFSLVADDRVLIFASAGRLYGRAPDSLAGLVEARGVGVVRRTRLAFAAVALRAQCVTAPHAVERLPENNWSELLGISLPTLTIWPFEASAPAKLAAALEHLGAGAQEGYLARFAPPAQARGGMKGPPLRHRK
jgi:serine kinase of HPr protein (carbohydrate metabolism regulator)